MSRTLTVLLLVCCVSLVNAAPPGEFDSTLRAVTGTANLQANLQAYPARLKYSSAFKKYPAAESRSSDNIEVAPEGDSYTLVPWISAESAGTMYGLSDTHAPLSLRFDQAWKDGGGNDFGSPGGRLSVVESLTDLGDGMLQIIVQVSAFDAQGEPEPWVDDQFAGEGFTGWGLDIGTTRGGGNPIEPDTPFTLVDSLAVALDSTGNSLGEFDIADSSDSNGLKAYVGLTLSGSDIAGFDISTIVIIWIIEVVPDNSGFDVTDGHSGAWYDPTHDGEGYLLQILSETNAIVFWFSYDTNGNQCWMVGSNSEINGSKITFKDLQITQGGKFGPNFDPDDVERMPWGSLQFQFSDCNNAVVTYEGPSGFGSGTLNVTRLSSTWGLNCSD